MKPAIGFTVIFIFNIMAHLFKAQPISNEILQVRTDPNNIKVVVGNTQTFPAVGSGLTSPVRSSNFIQPSGSVQNVNSKNVALNSANTGGIGTNADFSNTDGTHNSRVIIGGIQNFGGNLDEAIAKAKATADSNNVGGLHNSNVEIGGILNF